MRPLILGVALLAVVARAHAGSVTLDFGNALTVTTTAEQDAALRALVDGANATLPAGATPWTIEGYLVDRFTQAVGSWTAAHRQAEAVKACEAYTALDAAGQQAVKDALGGKSPCP